MHERQAIACAYVYGQTSRSYLPPHLTGEHYALYRNGKLLKPGEDPVLENGEHLLIACAPSGPVVAIIPYIVAAFFVSVVAGAIANRLLLDLQLLRLQECLPS
jgi:hypothetical protein